jgi:hypothetical protein
MGQWSTRTRRGGGSGGTAGTNVIILAQITGPNDITLSYLEPVTAANFENNDFDVMPADFVPISIAQATAAQLTLTFDSTIVGNTEIVYTGDVINVFSPQTVLLT